MKLSICIPSYNRGHRALPLVKKLLAMPLGKEELEVICSNNGSEKNTEGYEQMRQIRDERFHYHEFEENQGFSENVNQVIRMSQGDFCMLLSDEDDVVEPNLIYYRSLLEQHGELAVVRGKSNYMYDEIKDCYKRAGEEALEVFYLKGNYVSGIIYNRKIITDAVVGKYAVRYAENTAYQYYPHMFYDAYALLHGDYYSSEVWLVEEGKAEDDLVVAKDGPDEAIARYATWQMRMEQMHGFAEQIRDMDISPGLKFQMFYLLCNKTARLIAIPREKYENSGADWEGIMVQVSAQMKRELEFLELPLCGDEVQVVVEFIDSITLKSGEETI